MSKPNEIEKHNSSSSTSSKSSKNYNLFYLSKHLNRVYPIQQQRPSTILEVRSAKGNMYADLTSTPRDRKVVFEKPSAQESKVYSIKLDKTYSFPTYSFSSLSLSLSQTSDDEKLSSAFQKRQVPAAIKNISRALNYAKPCPSEKELMRCSWITTTSDKVYVQFHDECWGVPVYDDNRLFELLSLAGLLMDYNWTEILKRRELIREAFVGFNAKQVAKMGEKEIKEIISSASLILAENRVRSIVDNAKCIVKIGKEFGSFSCYMWNHMNYKPIINRFRNARNVPLRTPKAEAISKDLVKRGFRLVGPVIVNSFMQAAGMTIDHLLYCFRHKECVNLAERPWRHV